MSDSAKNNNDTQPRRSKRIIGKPKPGNYMGMRKNDSPSHFCRKTDTAIDKTVDELERIAREGGQRLFDIADSVLKSGESSSSENEDEGDDSANNVTEYSEEDGDKVTDHHTVLQEKVARRKIVLAPSFSQQSHRDPQHPYPKLKRHPHPNRPHLRTHR
ncbi:hypothetical protein PtrV1_02015 [Pyrenophora tritici-repentis]|nr:hypothetical protein PtrV1_02015 [Pyrenophora tritici-repentis]KAF7454750.1 hypothetical protein A1F99_020080 [Pyrenophora tritici-repentis]KAI0605554.1 hypothetical protein TUN205_10198 [Pyrenophora tritici-repentis]